MTTLELVELALLGLVSGLLGGLLGIGGSIVMIPVLTLMRGPDQHLYQAAAMIVNVFVAFPSAIRHGRAKATNWTAVRRMLPFAMVMIVVGVAVSDQFDGARLQQIFGIFLLYVIYVNVEKLSRGGDEPTLQEQRPTWVRAGFVGTVMGFMAGLLGIGGGIITVPLLQRVCVLPLRQCIACSSTVMCLTAILGAIRKNNTLAQHQHVLADSLEIAACLAPPAIIGGLIGASLTHVLPRRTIRVAFVILMVVAAVRMIMPG